MSKELIERIDNALRVKDAWVTDGQIAATAQLLRDCRAALAERGEAGAVTWREHVEQRLREWKQSHINRSGDRLSLDDFMDAESLEDLIDYVCDEWSGPAPAPAASVNERMRGVLLKAADYLREWDTELHGCDHEVGICDLRRTADELEALAAADAAPAAPGVTDQQIERLAEGKGERGRTI